MKESKEKEPKPDSLFEQCWVAYNRKGTKKVSRSQWDRLTDEMRQMALTHIPFYVQSRPRVYCKDFERYLRDRVFENPVYDEKGEMIFDPEKRAFSSEITALPGFQG